MIQEILYGIKNIEPYISSVVSQYSSQQTSQTDFAGVGISLLSILAPLFFVLYREYEMRKYEAK